MSKETICSTAAAAAADLFIIRVDGFVCGEICILSEGARERERQKEPVKCRMRICDGRRRRRWPLPRKYAPEIRLGGELQKSASPSSAKNGRAETFHPRPAPSKLFLGLLLRRSSCCASRLFEKPSAAALLFVKCQLPPSLVLVIVSWAREEGAAASQRRTGSRVWNRADLGTVDALARSMQKWKG